MVPFMRGRHLYYNPRTFHPTKFPRNKSRDGMATVYRRFGGLCQGATNKSAVARQLVIHSSGLAEWPRGLQYSCVTISLETII